MSQLVDNHPLARDLPEFKESIHSLKLSDAHFAKLVIEYESLDKEVVRVEQGVEIKSDSELDSLKMRRVHMKDTLYNMLQEHANQ